MLSPRVQAARNVVARVQGRNRPSPLSEALAGSAEHISDLIMERRRNALRQGRLELQAIGAAQRARQFAAEEERAEREHRLDKMMGMLDYFANAAEPGSVAGDVPGAAPLVAELTGQDPDSPQVQAFPLNGLTPNQKATQVGLSQLSRLESIASGEVEDPQITPSQAQRQARQMKEAMALDVAGVEGIESFSGMSAQEQEDVQKLRLNRMQNRAIERVASGEADATDEFFVGNLLRVEAGLDPRVRVGPDETPEGMGGLTLHEGTASTVIAQLFESSRAEGADREQMLREASSQLAGSLQDEGLDVDATLVREAIQATPRFNDEPEVLDDIASRSTSGQVLVSAVTKLAPRASALGRLDLATRPAAERAAIMAGAAPFARAQELGLAPADRPGFAQQMNQATREYVAGLRQTFQNRAENAENEEQAQKWRRMAEMYNPDRLPNVTSVPGTNMFGVRSGDFEFSLPEEGRGVPDTLPQDNGEQEDGEGQDAAQDTLNSMLQGQEGEGGEISFENAREEDLFNAFQSIAGGELTLNEATRQFNLNSDERGRIELMLERTAR